MELELTWFFLSTAINKMTMLKTPVICMIPTATAHPLHEREFLEVHREHRCFCHNWQMAKHRLYHQYQGVARFVVDTFLGHRTEGHHIEGRHIEDLQIEGLMDQREVQVVWLD